MMLKRLSVFFVSMLVVLSSCSLGDRKKIEKKDGVLETKGENFSIRNGVMYPSEGKSQRIENLNLKIKRSNLENVLN